jgi:hypothetical protein
MLLTAGCSFFSPLAGGQGLITYDEVVEAINEATDFVNYDTVCRMSVCTIKTLTNLDMD